MLRRFRCNDSSSNNDSSNKSSNNYENKSSNNYENKSSNNNNNNNNNDKKYHTDKIHNDNYNNNNNNNGKNNNNNKTSENNNASRKKWNHPLLLLRSPLLLYGCVFVLAGGMISIHQHISVVPSFRNTDGSGRSSSNDDNDPNSDAANGGVLFRLEEAHILNQCQPNSIPFRVEEKSKYNNNNNDMNVNVICQCMVETPICGGPLCGHYHNNNIEESNEGSHDNHNNNNNNNNTTSSMLMIPPQMIYPARCGADCQCVAMTLPFYGCSAENMWVADVEPWGLGSFLNNFMLTPYLGPPSSSDNNNNHNQRKTLEFSPNQYLHGCDDYNDESTTSSTSSNPLPPLPLYSYTCMLYPVSPCKISSSSSSTSTITTTSTTFNTVVAKLFRKKRTTTFAEARMHQLRHWQCSSNIIAGVGGGGGGGGGNHHQNHPSSTTTTRDEINTKNTMMDDIMDMPECHISKTTLTAEKEDITTSTTTTIQTRELDIRMAAARRMIRFIPSVERRIQEYELKLVPFFSFNTTSRSTTTTGTTTAGTADNDNENENDDTSQIQNNNKYLGFHIRRGDKVIDEAQAVSLETYIQAALSVPSSKGITQALVASDSPKTCREMIALLDHKYGIQGISLTLLVEQEVEEQQHQDHHHQQSNTKWQWWGKKKKRRQQLPGQDGYFQHGTFEHLSKEKRLDRDCLMLAEARMLAKATVMVGTISSNVFRLIMALRDGDASSTITTSSLSTIEGLLSVDLDDRLNQTSLDHQLLYRNHNVVAVHDGDGDDD